MSALPPLDQPFALPADTVAAYRRDGHTVLRGLASAAEVAAYRPLILAACDRMRYETRPLEERDTYGKAFLQYWGLANHDETVRRFVLARRFARVAAELMGVRGVRIYHDQALLKEPHGGPTPMHQDQFYWPFEAKAITMWMPLVPVPVEVGSMTFVDGSHTVDLGKFDISDASEQAVTDLIARQGLHARTHGAMAPGDATWHDGWTMHGAPPNPSESIREVMTIIYVDADARVMPPEPRHAGDMQMWLAGKQAGDLIDGPLHPVAWRA